MIESALVTLLTGDAGVAAIVGTRVYPQVILQNVSRPALAYQVISQIPQYVHQGETGTRTRIQITCEGDTYLQAKQLAQAVRTRLSGYKGTVGDVVIGRCMVDNAVDGYSEIRAVPVVRMDVTFEHN